MTDQSLADRLRADMNQARKQRDQARTLLLSTILSDIKNREIKLRHTPTDDETAEVVRRGVKNRREPLDAYGKPGRTARGPAHPGRRDPGGAGSGSREVAAAARCPWRGARWARVRRADAGSSREAGCGRRSQPTRHRGPRTAYRVDSRRPAAQRAR